METRITSLNVTLYIVRVISDLFSHDYDRMLFDTRLIPEMNLKRLPSDPSHYTWNHRSKITPRNFSRHCDLIAHARTICFCFNGKKKIFFCREAIRRFETRSTTRNERVPYLGNSWTLAGCLPCKAIWGCPRCRRECERRIRQGLPDSSGRRRNRRHCRCIRSWPETDLQYWILCGDKQQRVI